MSERHEPIERLTNLLREADQSFGEASSNEIKRRVGGYGGNWGSMSNARVKWIALELMEHGVKV